MSASEKEITTLIRIAGKLDPSLQRALISTQGLTSQTSKKFEDFGKAGKTALRGIGKAAGLAAKGMTILLSAGTAVVSVLAAKGYQTASALTEVQNVVDVTFGQGTERINSWSASLLKAFGLSELSAKKYSSTLGAMLKSSGIAGDDMMVMSQNLTELTGDMASFYDKDSEEIFKKLQSGISGETEPLKELGINMSVANLEAYALSQGIAKSYNAMNQAEQIQLRYNYLMVATADAQGDFTRTSSSAANQQRQLTENINSLSGKIMQSALPSMAKIMQSTNDFLMKIDINKLSEFITGMGDLAVETMPLAMEILPVMGDLLSSTMPSMLNLGKEVLPLVAGVIRSISEVLMPLMPIIVKIVENLLPPALRLVEALTPPLKIIAQVLGEVFNLLSKIIGWGTGKLADLVEFVQTDTYVKAVTPTMYGVPQFANGGFANRPSIFGEAGPEAAIPIKPGNRRSISLLAKTARLLGVSRQPRNDGVFNKISSYSSMKEKISVIEEGGNIRNEILMNKMAEISRTPIGKFVLSYSPVIHMLGSDNESLKTILYKHGNDMASMLDDYFDGKGRLAF